MSRLSDYLGRGVVPISQMAIHQAQDITPDSDLNTLVCLIGAGGSGGYYVNGDVDQYSTGQGRGHSQGGNAGGVCFQLVRMLAGETYSFTIGAGGAIAGVTSSVRAFGNGSAGTDTQLTSTATGFTTLVAKGGQPGVGWGEWSGTGTSSQDTAYPTQASWGSGADLIFPGGWGGKITTSITQSSGREVGFATGGGAVNLSGIDNELLRGGNIELSANSTGAIAATGGGGSSGNGGDIDYSSTSSFVIATGGGSGFQPGGVSDSATANESTAGGMALGYFPSLLFAMLGAGGDGVISNAVSVGTKDDGGNGSGGGAHVGGTALAGSGTLRAGNGGIFAGGAGAADHSFSGGGFPWVYGGNAGIGGGGGGACTSPFDRSSSGRAYSGAGGDGLALVFILSDFGRVLA